MNKYESIIIINPTKSEDEIKETINKFENIIRGFSERKVTIDNLGEKRLAYEVQNNKTGYYTVFYFYAKPENIKELERNYRIDENVMKHIVVRHEEHEFNETEEEDEEVQ